MSNYHEEKDKLRTHLAELERKHRELDNVIETRYNNITSSDEFRKMKTMKLWYKDEMHRINSKLIQLGLE